LTSEGGLVISALNQLVHLVEEHLTEEIDVDGWARTLGTTEHHLRRMFSSLAGMPLSEYVRRRRMTVAAADVVSGGEDLLSIAVRYGYASTEAFGRAFRSVHGTGPGQVRRDGGPLRTQPCLTFHLTVRGSIAMDVRILDRPEFHLVGHAARVPLIHQGVNPHITEHVASVPAAEHQRLKAMSETEPVGLLAVSDDLDPDRVEGSELTYLHGVALRHDTPVPEELDCIEVPAGAWAAFRSSGPYPATLQQTWAATATEWFPSNGWRLRPGPEIVAVLDRSEDFSAATCELWLPVEPA
jgi:AraC family transcriptional regulator